MKLGTSILIFFLAMIALVAEFILYMIFGFSFAMINDWNSLDGVAFFFGSLVILTIATGIIAPISAVVEMLIKKKNIGYKILLYTDITILILLFMANCSQKSHNEVSSKKNDSLESNNEEIAIDIKERYIDSIVIKNIKIENSIYNEPNIKGEIKNIGSKSLRNVKVVIYFFDKNNKAIFEDIRWPISSSNHFSSTEPLKPNYSRKFSFFLSDVPSEWSKKVELKVQYFDFEEMKKK
jgi:hypothetical protein